MTNTALLTAIGIVFIGILAIMFLEHQDHNPFDTSVESANQAYEALYNEAEQVTSNSF